MNTIAPLFLVILCLGATDAAAASAVIPSPLFADPNYHGSCDPEIVWNPQSGIRHYTPPAEKRTVRQKLSYLQIAELKLIDGKLICDRDAELFTPIP